MLRFCNVGTFACVLAGLLPLASSFAPAPSLIARHASSPSTPKALYGAVTPHRSGGLSLKMGGGNVPRVPYKAPGEQSYQVKFALTIVESQIPFRIHAPQVPPPTLYALFGGHQRTPSRHLPPDFSRLIPSLRLCVCLECWKHDLCQRMIYPISICLHLPSHRQSLHCQTPPCHSSLVPARAMKMMPSGDVRGYDDDDI